MKYPRRERPKVQRFTPRFHESLAVGTHGAGAAAAAASGRVAWGCLRKPSHHTACHGRGCRRR
eukprot:5239131-Pyramimonas_sp.AAC.1